MLKWVKIKKRTGNAVLHGVNLGEKPHVEVTVRRLEDIQLPRPQFRRSFVKPRDHERTS